MDKALRLAILLLYAASCQGQILQQVFQSSPPTIAAISLEASCTGNGTTNYLPCSSAMTVTAGDAIVCKVVGVSGGSSMGGSVVDSVNGWYDAVWGIVSPASATSWETTAVFINSAGGSITPILQYKATPSTRATINCKAFKNAATLLAMDPGAVEQNTSATVTNPTSGTAAAPTFNNELVWGVMSRSNATAPSSGGGAWLPAGTLTLVGSSSVRQADEYQIQTTATSVNAPFTGNTTSVATVDSQLAILPLGQSGGTRAVTGWSLPLGSAGSAPTGTVTASLLGASTSFLSTVNPAFNASPYWAEQGATAKTYDTTINPTATGHFMFAGVDHTFGDAGSSIKFAGATANGNGFSLENQWVDQGEGAWVWSFYRLASGTANNTFCDMIDVKGGVPTFELTFQAHWLTASGFNVTFEQTDSTSHATSIISPFGSLADTDLRVGFKFAGVNDRYNQFILQTKSGGVWSQTGSTMNLDVLCSNGGGSGTCANPPAAIATPTGTASSGSTALTVSSGTGILAGQVVIGAGIPDPSQTGHPAWTVVEAVSGTSVTLSQNTTASLSGTPLSFYTAPVAIAAATNCSVTAGSTAMSCVLPTVGTISAGQSVGGSGILAGTVVSAASGAGPVSVTLSIPAQATMAAGSGASFWTATSQTHTITIGKEASCNITSDQWLSGLAMDEAATGALNNPN